MHTTLYNVQSILEFLVCFTIDSTLNNVLYTAVPYTVYNKQ